MTLQPVALNHPTSLADFLLWTLRPNAPPTALVICTDRASFLAQLQASMDARNSLPIAEMDSSTFDAEPEQQPDTPATQFSQTRDHHPLLSRTMGLLAAAQSVSLAYCSSVPALHAYLATLPREPNGSFPSSRKPDHGTRTRIEAPGMAHGGVLALINPLALHRDSGSYSAQSLGRGLAAATEASWRCGARLVVLEHCGARTGVEMTEAGDAEAHGAGNLAAEAPSRGGPDAAPEAGNLASAPASRHEETDPWEEEIPIVNPATKASGVSGDRDWMARKVRARSVVARFCSFRGMGEL